MNVETGRISTNVTGQISVIVKGPRVSEPPVLEETASNSSETGPHEERRGEGGEERRREERRGGGALYFHLGFSKLTQSDLQRARIHLYSWIFAELG